MVSTCSVGLARRGNRSAFTLLELLVVIAIIALLIAILLPSLESARCASKNAACLAHIKNIGTSSRVYEADDPNGWGIPVHPLQFLQDPKNPIFVGAYEWGGKSGVGKNPDPTSGDFQTIPGASGYRASKYGTAAGFGPSTRPMNLILYPGGFADNARNRRGQEQDTELDLELFKCPADDGPPRGAHCESWLQDDKSTSSYDWFGNSYAANLFMVGRVGAPCFLSNSPYLRSITRVPSPARTLYYEENIGRWAWAARRENTPCFQFSRGVDPGPTKTIPGWHGRDWTFNRVFVDAHAETQRIYIEGTEDEDGFAEHYTSEALTFYPPFIGTSCFRTEPDDSDQDDRRLSYSCIIVRGPGWAKDTMPADPIFTGITWQAAGRPSYEDCVKPTD